MKIRTETKGRGTLKQERVALNSNVEPMSRRSGLWALFIPAFFVLILFGLSSTQRVQESQVVESSIFGVVGFLSLWLILLCFWTLKRGVTYDFIVNVRPQHYIQAMVQSSVYLYWGYYWSPVYAHFWLLLSQICFAFCFDILLAWSQRKKYVLGFGPIPIVFSINLFLWFRDDWFYLQFIMLSVGILGKEFVRWHREGRLVHIFNPSAFALGIFSLILISTETSHLTWGQEIASTLTLAPNIYSFLFIIGLVVMYFFSITLVTGGAALVLLLMSASYFAATGVPYFLDSEIPAAVFLGLHLLITDPSTSPRTPLGKAIFGMLYGFGVFALYTILGAIGAPTFYDKLLCVPLLNLSVIAIDRLVSRINSRNLIAVWNESWSWAKPNIAHMVVWVLVFVGASTLGKMDGRHIGDSVPFWDRSCTENLTDACDRLILLKTTYCQDNSAWACNELGVHFSEGKIVGADNERSVAYFTKACELKFTPACVNLLSPSELLTSPPKELDLRLMTRQGGLNLMDLPSESLYRRACEHGWEFACRNLVAGS